MSMRGDSDEELAINQRDARAAALSKEGEAVDGHQHWRQLQACTANRKRTSTGSIRNAQLMAKAK